MTVNETRLVLIMTCGHIVFSGLVTFTQNGVNAFETAIMIFHLRNWARLKFHLGALRQFDCFQRPEHAAFIDCMDRLHVLLLPCRWPQGQFLLRAFTE
jgi:hypothetical protein